MKKITLDGAEISNADLSHKIQEAKKNGKKIVEQSPGVYKTLQKLNG